MDLIVQQKNRFHLLDVLRLVAALGVVFYHYSIYWPDVSGGWLEALCDSGYLGVNFFFMLSGFVIMASAEGRTSIAFAMARAKRLYPAFITCLIITALVVWGLTGYEFSFKQLFWNATILNDYVKVPNVDGVYWTLQAELKFYACVFILITIGILNKWCYWLPVWLILAIIFYYVKQPFFMGWFINPQYSFYFIAGVCCYLLYKDPKSKVLLTVLAVSFIYALLNAKRQVVDFIPHQSEYQEYTAQLVVAGFFAFFYATSRGYLQLKQVPFWWAYLGAISYPLYLLHNRAGKTIIDYFGGTINIYILSIGVVALLVALCLCIHLCIEKPLNRLLKAL